MDVLYTRGDPVNRGDRRGLCDYDISNGQYYNTESAWQEAAYTGLASFTDNVVDNGSCSDGDDGPSYSSVLYDQPPAVSPSGGSGGSTSPPPTCDQVLTADITTYLASYDGGTSPLNTAGNIETLVDFGMEDNVDPRFITALAVAETQAGINMNWGPFNAWDIRVRNPKYTGPGKQPAYTSWSQSIGGITGLIAGPQYFGLGLTTTSTIYAKFEGPGYQKGLGNLNTAVGQMSGSQNALTDPCDANNLRQPNP